MLCSPMGGVLLPDAGQKLIPLISDAETQQILDACKGSSFLQLRDQALVRMYYNTGARLSEIGCLLVTEVDLDTNSVLLHGKGGKDRRVRFGAATARVLTRYGRTASRSASNGSARRPDSSGCTPIGGGTALRTNGSWPAATPAT